MEEKTISLPSLEAAHELARECYQLRCLGAISGAPGTGKTTALKAIERTCAARPGQGACHYFRAYPSNGATRGARDLLESLGVPGPSLPSNSSLPFTVGLAIKKLGERNIDFLLVDEADSWAQDSLRGFVSLYDAAAEAGKPFAALLAGTPSFLRWLGELTSALSRTLRCQEFQNLDAATALALLREWEPSAFSAIASAAKDKEPKRCIDAIYRCTGGNPRRLSYFTNLYRLHFAQEPANEEKIKNIAARLHSQP